MAALYSPLILDHHRNPRNNGSLEPHDASAEDINALCGDLVRIDLRIHDGAIADIRFSGRGCAISQAATSLLTECVKGRNLAAVGTLSDDAFLDMLDIPLSTSRRECALLGLRVLRHCLSDATT